MDEGADSRDDLNPSHGLDFELENNISNDLQNESYNRERREDEFAVLVDGEEMKANDDDLFLKEKVPYKGKEFDTEEEAYAFYNEYARETGFSIRRGSAHRDNQRNILDRTFCCSCEGRRQEDKRDVNVKAPRPETRTGCHARMKINARRLGKFEVDEFIAEHFGHKLVPPTLSHRLRSHRTITPEQATQVNDIDKSGIPLKSGLDYMAQQAGGREKVGFILEDLRNFLRSKRMMQMKEGEAGAVLNYLQVKQLEDPTFFYAVQVDVDDLLTNVFWADGQMMVDYHYFGEVVCFDTTYRKLKEGRPFALFVGANHHRQTTVFGAALLYDETAETFMWLFDTFVKAMNGKRPLTILTDQDAAMAKALEERWPQTNHRLCIWHIYKNAAINLHDVFVKFPPFLKDFNSCIYDYEEEEEFINAWKKMLDTYALHKDAWLKKMFKKKEKWALVYGRQHFSADMTTTQRSESIHGVLKKYVNTSLSLIQFFEHFGRLVDDRRYEEMKADLRTNHSIPNTPFLVEIIKHARTVYTHEVFKLFQEEMVKGHDSKLEIISESDAISKYKVTPLKKKYPHTVTYDVSKERISCSCRKFEFGGILCLHALKVLSSKNIVKIPEVYIMKRWTKMAKKGIDASPKPPASSHACAENMKEEYEKMRIKERNKDLGQIFNQVTALASLTEERYESARSSLIKMFEEMDKSTKKDTPTSKVIDGQVRNLSHDLEHSMEKEETNSQEIVIRGWKKRESKSKSAKRIKSGLEQATSKRKPKQKKKLPENSSSSPCVLETNALNASSEINFLSTMPHPHPQRTPGPSVPSPQFTQLSQNASSEINFLSTMPHPQRTPGPSVPSPQFTQLSQNASRESNFLSTMSHPQRTSGPSIPLPQFTQLSQSYPMGLPSWTPHNPDLSLLYRNNAQYPFQFMPTSQSIQEQLNPFSQHVVGQRGNTSLTEVLQPQVPQGREFGMFPSINSTFGKEHLSRNKNDNSPKE